ncbi:MAG: glycosyltransferase family 4 protein [Gemmatimonadaceae bacterium]|nr:glycosyltransferase family 4 protein [Gloeobacterales cyanobacterium ES-bin-141]
MTVVFNGSYLTLRPTGIGNYALNLWQCWRSMGLPLREFLPAQFAGNDPQVQRVQLRGHTARLVWNQAVLPWLLRPGELLFNPVPEGPLVGRTPQVTMAHDVIPLIYPHWFASKVGYFRYLIPACLGRSTRIVCNSEQTRTDLVRFYNLDPASISVIALACNRSLFFAQPVSDARLARYGLKPRQYMLYVGAHAPHKNLARLLTAFKELGDWEGVLAIGGGMDKRYTPELVRLAHRLGLGERVRWLDYIPVEDLAVLYSGARLFAYISLYEGFGLPVLEAMACGTPVLTSSTTALAELAGNSALTVHPEDTEAIVKGLGKLLNPETNLEYSRRSLERASQFSWHDTATATWQVIEQAAHEVA